LADNTQQIGNLRAQLAYLYARGSYADALPVAEEALRLSETSGDEDLDYSISLGWLGELCRVVGDLDRAEPLLRRTAAIRRSILGSEHPGVATVLNNLGSLYIARGSYAEAEPLLEEALEIRSKTLPEGHPDLVLSLDNLATVRKSTRRYDEAQRLLEEAYRMRREMLGDFHPAVAGTLVSLGDLYRMIGRDSEAEQVLVDAGETLRVNGAEMHPAYAESLVVLGSIYFRRGDYALANECYSSALELNREQFGDTDARVVTCLSNLGALHRMMGDPARAERFILEALSASERTSASGGSRATLLNNLAGVYEDIADYAAAERIYNEAADYFGESARQSHEYAVLLNNLAGVCQAMGELDDAERHFLKANAIMAATVGEKDPDFATNLHTLAALYTERAEFDRARPLYRRALAIRRTAFGDSHPAVATSFHTLGTFHLLMGEDVEAEKALRRAVELRRTLLGEQHRHYAASLHVLGTLYARTDRPDEALELLTRASAVDDRTIGDVFRIGSERQRLAFAQKYRAAYEVFLSFVMRDLGDSAAAVAAVFDLTLRRKGMVADALAEQRHAVLRDRDPVLRSMLADLAELRSRISAKVLAGPGLEGFPLHLKLLQSWQTQEERLERRVALHIGESTVRVVDLEHIAAALPDASALAELVLLRPYVLNAAPGKGEPNVEPERYVAFVVPAGDHGSAQMIDLGLAEPIDRALRAFRASVTGRAEGGEQPAASNRIDAGRRLRALVLDRIAAAVPDRQRLILSPDGELTRLPFEALPLDDGRDVVDEYRLSYVSSGRDVLRFGTESESSSEEPLVAADPDFDLAVAAPPEAAPAQDILIRHSRVEHAKHFPARRLEGTRAEGKHIAAMLGVDPLLDGAVVEGRLKTARSPRVLHLATHAFFLPDTGHHPKKREIAPVEDLGRLAGPGMADPLLRSSLVLAGFNTWYQGGWLPEDAEDGVLTAKEVSGIDLLGTDLVVLSACDTGLGDAYAGEGVFGLRRSFVAAGARTLVMSLWKVPDTWTRRLMTAFYERLLAGDGRADALREAQLVIKRRNADPRVWGAFICQGDPGPLTMGTPSA
jgi:CHAT domain-containing protein/tetratricopeptide (TPR) repeat protein